MAMSYGYVYVAQVGMGADKNQLMKAMHGSRKRTMAHLMIIAYAPCINHGLEEGHGQGPGEHQRRGRSRILAPVSATIRS